MTLLDDTKTRIEAKVQSLTGGGLQEAADMSALIAANQLPQQPIAGFILPAGLDGGLPDAVTGLFRQVYDETLSVVLIVQAPGDAAATRALPTIDQLIVQVLEAVCGWAPPGIELGAQFRLRRGRMISVTAGAAWYQLDFSVQRQLRIAS